MTISRTEMSQQDYIDLLKKEYKGPFFNPDNKDDLMKLASLQLIPAALPSNMTKNKLKEALVRERIGRTSEYRISLVVLSSLKTPFMNFEAVSTTFYKYSDNTVQVRITKELKNIIAVEIEESAPPEALEVVKKLQAASASKD